MKKELKKDNKTENPPTVKPRVGKVRTGIKGGPEEHPVSPGS